MHLSIHRSVQLFILSLSIIQSSQHTPLYSSNISFILPPTHPLACVCLGSSLSNLTLNQSLSATAKKTNDSVLVSGWLWDQTPGHPRGRCWILQQNRVFFVNTSTQHRIHDGCLFVWVAIVVYSHSGISIISLLWNISLFYSSHKQPAN